MKKLFSWFLDALLKILGIKHSVLKKYKPLSLVFLITLFFLCIEWLKTFDANEIVEYKRHLLYLAQDHPLSLSIAFFLVYLFAATLSLPGTTAFNIIGGFLFGFIQGTVLAIFAVSIGCCFAFLITRFFLRDFFIKKGGVKMKKIYGHLKKDEVYYLFAFRLFPFIPLFFTNIVMGLSSIRLSVFYIVSFISLLPAMVIYANMGSQLSQLENLQGLAEPNVLFAFSLVGLFPLFVKYFFKFFKRLQKSRKKLPLESDSLLLG